MFRTRPNTSNADMYYVWKTNLLKYPTVLKVSFTGELHAPSTGMNHAPLFDRPDKRRPTPNVASFLKSIPTGDNNHGKPIQ